MDPQGRRDVPADGGSASDIEENVIRAPAVETYVDSLSENIHEHMSKVKLNLNMTHERIVSKNDLFAFCFCLLFVDFFL